MLSSTGTSSKGDELVRRGRAVAHVDDQRVARRRPHVGGGDRRQGLGHLGLRGDGRRRSPPRRPPVRARRSTGARPASATFICGGHVADRRRHAQVGEVDDLHVAGHFRLRVRGANRRTRPRRGEPVTSTTALAQRQPARELPAQRVEVAGERQLGGAGQRKGFHRAAPFENALSTSVMGTRLKRCMWRVLERVHHVDHRLVARLAVDLDQDDQARGCVRLEHQTSRAARPRSRPVQRRACPTS